METQDNFSQGNIKLNLISFLNQYKDFTASVGHIVYI